MRPSICFVALNSYGVLSGDPRHRHVGGAEVQQLLVARGLVERGYDVRFVTLDHGQEDACPCGGIRVFKAYKPGAGMAGLRLFHPKWTHLASALRRADADVYYQRTCGIESGQVCLWCRRRGRSFVFGVGSDADCDAALPSLSSFLDRRLYRYAIRRADAIISQTEIQRRMLLDGFHRSSTVVRSCRPVWPESQPARPPGPPRILWVGRFSPPKRPELCLDIAEQRKDLLFDIVGAGNSSSFFAGSIAERAQAMSNVKLHGFIPYEQMGRFYQDASVLLSTSLYEGFPNTFLEAWSHGRPVVGTMDPDSIVLANGLGRVGADVRSLAAGLDELLFNEGLWEEVSQRARRYVAEHHSVDAAVTGYEAVLKGLAVKGARN